LLSNYNTKTNNGKKINLEEIHQPPSTDNSKFKERGHGCRDSDFKKIVFTKAAKFYTITSYRIGDLPQNGL
jgi:hypothetical protein